MRPKQPKAEPQEDLFRARLQNVVDSRHPLVRLAALIDWGRFETEFGALYTEGGRPGLPTRLMVGLHLLNVWPAPSASVFAARSDQSTPTYPVSEHIAPAKMEIRASRSS